MTAILSRGRWVRHEDDNRHWLNQHVIYGMDKSLHLIYDMDKSLHLIYDMDKSLHLIYDTDKSLD